MLAATHVVTGALVGLVVERPLPRVAAALASHALLDIIDHEDTMAVLPQGALAAAALGALTLGAGRRSQVLSGALAATVPDLEIAIGMLSGREGPYLFPTHWQVAGRRGQHPWQLRMPPLRLGMEIAAMAALCGLVCALSRR